MPNLRSSKKDVRRTKRRQAHNRFHKDRVKASRRALNKLIAEGNFEASPEAISNLYTFVDRAAREGVIHKNKADRLKSRAVLAVRRHQAAKEQA